MKKNEQRLNRQLEALESELTAEQWLESKEHTYWLNQLVQTEGEILRLTYFNPQTP